MISERILIHVGYHKTGSTFLQRRVFPALGVKQVMLPMEQISDKYGFDKEHLLFTVGNSVGLTCWDRNIIISQESLVGHKDGHGLWDGFTVARNLKEVFPNAKILVVIRNQFDYIISLYTFNVFIKGSERKSLANYLRSNSELVPGLREHLQYDRLIRHYQSLFGTDSVLVMVYEDLGKNDSSFVAKIMDFIEIESFIEYPTGRVNTSSKKHYPIEVSRFLNHPYSLLMQLLIKQRVIPPEQPSPHVLSQGYMRFRKRIVNPILSSIFSASMKTIEFPLEWHDSLHPIFARSNERLATITNIDLQGHGYPWPTG